MRIMLSLSEEMHSALENEKNQLVLKNIQNAIRMIVSRYFNSEMRSKPQANIENISIKDDLRSCEDVHIKEALTALHPFIDLAQDLGESSDVIGAVRARK